MFSTDVKTFEITIEPSGGFPMYQWLTGFVGDAAGIGLIVCALALIAGAGMWGFSKLSGSAGIQKGGFTVIGIAVGAAIVIGSVGAIINWASSQDIITMGHGYIPALMGSVA